MLNWARQLMVKAVPIRRLSAHPHSLSHEPATESFGRRSNYWEPIYDPNLKQAYPKANWDFAHSSGPTEAVMDANSLKFSPDPSFREKFIGKAFDHCDFVGDFNRGKVNFKECSFTDCDFGTGIWKHIKFTRCRFIRCSFSLTTFDSCEFRRCGWEDIGISGNETRIIDSNITNPAAFIEAAYTNTNPGVLTKFGKTAQYQRMRLERTKASVARAILAGLANLGDEKAYYEAVRTSANQTLRANFRQYCYWENVGPWYKRPCYWALNAGTGIEWVVINIFGSINKWGASISRPIFFGILIFLIFSIVYSLPPFSQDILSAILRSFDVTMVVGYTRVGFSHEQVLRNYITSLNVLMGIGWYAVFAATVVGRVSRTR